MKLSLILRQLQSRGHKMTKLRQLILARLTNLLLPVSATELLQELHRDGHAFNKTTIYRELEFLLSRGIVQEIHWDDRTTRYELHDDQGHHHHHLVCRQCRGVEDVACNPSLKRTEQEIAEQYNFQVERHALEFFGVCAACRQAGGLS